MVGRVLLLAVMIRLEWIFPTYVGNIPLRVCTSDVRRKYGSWTKPLRGSFFEIPSTLFFDHQIIE